METRALAQLAEVITGSSPDRRVARDAVPFIQIKDLSIPLPSLQRQRQIGALFHLAHQEAALLEQLATHTAHLRSRQLAAAFATLESQSP